MLSSTLFLLTVFTGVAHAKTDWSIITPDSDLNTSMVIYTILAVAVTVVQSIHGLAAVGKMEAGLGRRTFVFLLPGLVSLLALYILRTYFLIHYNSTHFPRAFYAMLYFTEQFSNILIAVSTMILLYCTERDWYQNTVILRARKGLGFLIILGWLGLVVAQAALYRQPSDVDHNPLLTIALYQDELTHAIIGFYNFVTLDIALSAFILWIHARRRPDPEAGADPRIKILLLITALLAIRSLALLVVHVISIVSIPTHLANTIWNLIFCGWLMLDPTLCYIALYALLHSSQVEPPIKFRVIVATCCIVAAGVLKTVLAIMAAMCGPRIYVVQSWGKTYVVEEY
ncbi:hypothetical protein C8F04DRAFT_1241413 [Mycena alexandri]|uniref:Uncharacterized protein n=1 Tax=Mycena alexandri TaxID=1745969 RepID=A0AAD6WNT5_9AGAR|nr:hypothetical protein C8F04DRAFT_1241413 [Mycena alexandri]